MTKRKKPDFSKVEFKPGDTFVVRGRSAVGKLITKLIWRKDGVFRPFTHVQHALSGRLSATAEAKGYILENHKRLENSAAIKCYRPTHMDENAKSLMQFKTREYIGKDYDYYQYFLHLIRISEFYFPSIIQKIISPILSPLKKYLEKKEKNSVSCHEAWGEIMIYAGLIKIDDPTWLTPHQVYQILENSPAWELIYEFDEEGK